MADRWVARAAAAVAVPVVLLGGCTNDPAHLVMRAAAAAPATVPVRMTYRVATSGEQGGYLYLNSEADYRDQRNVTLDLSPGVRAALARQLGGDPARVLRGRRLRVTGRARREHIDFLRDGRPTGKYYYQTHIAIDDPAQIRLLKR